MIHDTIAFDVYYDIETKQLFINNTLKGKYNSKQAAEEIRDHFISQVGKLKVNNVIDNVLK